MQRTFLFVPATRLDRLLRALESRADAVIVDLEDAVLPEEKVLARRALVEWLAKNKVSKPLYVRVNAVGTEWHDGDLEGLRDSLRGRDGRGIAGVMLPKSESSEQLAGVVCRLGLPLLALVETAAGVANLAEIASEAGVARVALGAIDLSNELGCEIGSATMDWVYAQMVLSSKLAGLPAPLASPPTDIAAHAAIAEDSKRLREMGLGGRMCIHPDQLSAVNEGFAPTSEQISWAKRILAAEGGAARVGGQMVDKPVREKAEQILKSILI